MSGEVIRWWSMWSHTMASGGENAADRSMKSREVVDVVGKDTVDIIGITIVMKVNIENRSNV